jgi:signal transduction histidine kinase
VAATRYIDRTKRRVETLIEGVPPLVLDAALAGAVAAFGLVQTLQHGPGPGPGPGSYRETDHGPLFAVAVALPLVLRSRVPLLPLLAIPLAFIYRLDGGENSNALLPAVLLALYTVVASGPYSRATNWAWGIAGAAVFLLSHYVGRHTPPLSFVATDLGWVASALILGDAMRSRRALAAAAELRAHEAELTREEEARRRVSEERVAIARELHDVVAHHISLINVQAGVGAHLMDTDPQQSREAFEHIMDASHATLQELRSLVGVLREPLDTAAPLAPTRGLDGLDELLRSVRSAGVEVQVEEAGARRELPGPIDRSAFRILQEALTNVVKHAPGASAAVRIEYAPNELRLTVTNSVDGRQPDGATGGGHGLHGMRERVEALGGAITAGLQPDGQFRVRAVLPFDGRDA